jgi:hypothetical protein
MLRQTLIVVLLVVLVRSQPGYISMAQQIAQICNYNVTCMNGMPPANPDVSVSNASLNASVWDYYEDVDLVYFECPAHFFPDPNDITLCVPNCKTKGNVNCTTCRSLSACHNPSVPPCCLS